MALRFLLKYPCSPMMRLQEGKVAKQLSRNAVSTVHKNLHCSVTAARCCLLPLFTTARSDCQVTADCKSNHSSARPLSQSAAALAIADCTATGRRLDCRVLITISTAATVAACRCSHPLAARTLRAARRYEAQASAYKPSPHASSPSSQGP